jgi:hypothetical protein
LVLVVLVEVALVIQELLVPMVQYLLLILLALLVEVAGVGMILDQFGLALLVALVGGVLMMQLAVLAQLDKEITEVLVFMALLILVAVAVAVEEL